MRKVALVALVMIQFIACKDAQKKEKVSEKNETTEILESFNVENARTTMEFTAYKTTAKVPVKGTFNLINIIKSNEGLKNIRDAVNGTEFSIPVSSIETNDLSRNEKIIKFFFDMMTNTSNITGTIHITDDSQGYLDLKLNNISKKLVFEYEIKEKTFHLNALMNVDNWDAQAALSSLNEACLDLHRGEDGVSKTWNEVAIQAIIAF